MISYSAPPSPILLNTVTQGDCLTLLPRVASASVDMVLCDLPYGTTQNKWDSVIPFEPLWAQYARVCKPGAAIVLTCAQPFTSALVMSNPKMFKYEWVWCKVRVTGHLNAKKQPLRAHESVVVFYAAQCLYNPQMTPSGGHIRGPFGGQKKRTENYGVFSDDNRTHEASEYYPRSIITFQAEMQSVHPTQKPVALWEYLIRTYTNEGDTVLDNCCGSGTTGVACQNTGRNFIQMELSPEYCEIARSRLKAPGTLVVHN
jgi:site-specific DNA-methyltransferase (adenine-specific)